MTKEIRVARLIAPGKPFEVGTAPMPSMGTNDVLVKVKSANVAPNLANVTGGESWYQLPDLPAILGLDAAGVVEDVGRNVLDIKRGDRVYLDPTLSCGECRECRRGFIKYCRYYTSRGYFNIAPDGNQLQRLYPYGGLSEYLTSPSTKVARLPDNVDFDTAARLGYLGTSYAALVRGKLRPRGTLLINGVTGTLGVGAVQMALGLGVRRILGIGRRPDVMARVKSLAPDRIDVTSYDPATTVQWVKDRTGGRGVDVMYDCLGHGGSADWTSNLLNAIAPEGNCALVAGGVEGQICRDYLSLMSHPISITWSHWFTSAEIDDFIELIGEGTIDVSASETRAFRLDQVNDALALAGSRPGGFVDVMIHPDK